MITVYLAGGLGNQMFQYASGKALAARLGTDLLLDVSWYTEKHETMTARNFELSSFPNIQEEIKTYSLEHFFLSNNLFARITCKVFRLFHKDLLVVFFNFFDEKYSSHVGEFHSMKYKKLFLEGYWQNEQYFSDKESLIRHSFVFPDPADIRNKNLIKKLKSSRNYVSLHVRRGDYVTDPLAKCVHGGICTEQYYLSALKVMQEHIPEACFVVFSDDMNWVKAEMKLPEKTIYVDWNQGINSFYDMQLMAACSHHIVANSSFSWWGAWLDDNPEKIVVAPSRWFASGDAVLLENDVVPKNWIRI